MADSSKFELENKGPEIINIENESKIPIRKGHIIFNPGHTSDLQTRYEPALDSNIATKYKIPKGANDYGSEDPDREASDIDLDKLAGSLLVYNEDFMGPLMDMVAAQLSTDLYSTQAAKALVEMGAPANLRLARGKRVLMNNVASVMGFLKKLDGVDEFDSVEKVRAGIIKTVKKAQEDFGKSGKFKSGDQGWKFGEGDKFGKTTGSSWQDVQTPKN